MKNKKNFYANKNNIYSKFLEKSLFKHRINASFIKNY